MMNVDTSKTQDLTTLLEEAEEVPLVGGGKSKVIDWDAELAKLAEAGKWFQAGEVTKDIEKRLKKNGVNVTVYYSQLTGVFQREDKKGQASKYIIKKKKIETGDYKGTYFKVLVREPSTVE